MLCHSPFAGRQLAFAPRLAFQRALRYTELYHISTIPQFREAVKSKTIISLTLLQVQRRKPVFLSST